MHTHTPNAYPPRVLIDLPHGLGVSGVATWARRLARTLTSRGWPTRILAGPTPNGHESLPRTAADHLDIVQVPAHAESDHAARVRFLRDLIRAAATAERPVVLLPNLTSASYAAAAAVSTLEPELVRIIGWQHSDTAFDRSLLAYHEPMQHRFVAVSTHIASTLRDTLPARAADVQPIPYGVEIPTNTPGTRFSRGEPIRLIYTGRIEHEQKRIGVLCELARRLAAANVPHRLTLLGDGPAADEVDAVLAPLPHADRLPPTDPAGVHTQLAASHLLVLPSRYEGLSVSMLEAMAAGVAPIATGVRSGAAQAIDPGTSGVLIDPEGADADVAARFASVIASLASDPDRVASLRAGAAAKARSSFSLDAHADRVLAMFEAALAEPPRPWPASRACSYDAAATSPAGFTSVPSDANERTQRVLQAIADDSSSSAKVAILGAGRHTLAVADALAASPVSIACVIDDNPAAHGTTLWGWPVVGAEDAIDTGVTDVVLSSWLHVDTLWQGRARFTDRGVRVHRLYDTAKPAAQSPAACA